MSLLEVRDLCVEFGSRRVVDRVSFSLDAGEKLALVGESGSGKTVTALSLLRLIETARLSGEILFGGKDVLKMPDPALRELRGRDIAVIFQEPMTALNPIFTVGDQIAESLQLHTALRGEAARAEAVAALRRVGLDDPETPRPQLPAPALGRSAPARDDRDGARLQPEGARRRRADHGPGRHPSETRSSS